MKVLLAALSLLPAALLAQPAKLAPADASSRASVGPAPEPGDRLTISGIVYDEDGRTPLRSASVFVYQTDARGYYRPDNPRDSDNPRLFAHMRTDAQGRYEFRTVKPGSYPGTRNPGHIHYHVRAPGYRERVFEIVFAGDTLIPEQWLRDAANPDGGVAIVRLEADGARALRGTQNVTLRKN